MYIYMTHHGKTRVQTSWWGGWAGGSGCSGSCENEPVQNKTNKRCLSNEEPSVHAAERRSGLLF